MRIILSLYLFIFSSLSLLCTANENSNNLASQTNDKNQQQWDVNNPPGDAYEATIDVHNGTWMNLTLSPDNTTLVFDLLGDLYTLPIEGGEAAPLTSTIAWDMQAQFSPDGKSIAYTSDQGGGNNIWTMDINGSNQRQITKENYRLLNNPRWSPDGRFIAARKHFTSRRSLGAGEIWLYHLSGGEGLQLNQRPNDEKDLGEPEFSPDGRYVYFSQDTTLGNKFKYSKNSNAQIYEIKRIDRHTGDIDPLIKGAGGAVRPTASPDGKKLAFVRRIRQQTTLFIKDLINGKEQPVYHKLSRDLQETWAIHGVYPNMAWTKDSRDIIFWANGNILRLNTETGKTSKIPFHVKHHREMREALRFPVEVAPDQFNAKMLRWMQISPKGDQIIFQALGYLYSQKLPDGKPKRLTRQNNHYEFYPRFSSDGKWIVYTSWNDQTLGTVKKIRSNGSKSLTLNKHPGHYIEPTFSPDGKNVVYRAIRNGRVTSPLWTLNPGIYQVRSDGKSTPELISKKGSQPHYDSKQQHLFLIRKSADKKNPATALIRINLKTRAEKELVSTEFATTYHLSPDEKWLAYVERFHIYIVPFTRSTQTINLSNNAKNLSVQRITKNAGDYLHWSQDSQTLHWSLGPTLFSQKLTDNLTFVPQQEKHHQQETQQPRSITSTPTKTHIQLTVDADKPSGLMALVGGRIITMNGNEIIENGSILIENNRIKAIGLSSKITIPKHAKTIQLDGKTLIPGLIDVHWHGSQGHKDIIPQQNWYNYASLAFGVTTIHDPSNRTSEIFSAKEMQKAGYIVAPRIFSTGRILYGAKSNFTATVNNLDDAKTHIARMQAVGAISVKSYNQPRRDQRQQMLAAAKDAGIMVLPEGGSLFQNNMSMIVDGHTGIEHSIPIVDVYDDVKQLWQQSRTGYTPTLMVAYGGIWGENYWYQHTEVWKHPLLRKYVPRERLQRRSVRRTMAPEEDYNHIQVARVAKELQDLGVNVNTGAHGQREGLAAHWEIWSFVQGGMTPHNALRTASIDAAKYLGMDKDIGSLEVGKLADLVILNTNPLENIRNSDQVHSVMINGRLYESETMHERGLRNKKRQLFYWE